MQTLNTITYESPNKNYHLRVVNGKPRFACTPSVKEKKPRIYRMKDHQTGRRYIGYSSDIENRGKQHLRPSTKTEFQEAVSKHLESGGSPSRFSLGTVKELHLDDHFGEAEKTAIIASKSHINGFNKNSGGGGGMSKVLYVEKKRRREIETEMLPECKEIKQRRKIEDEILSKCTEKSKKDENLREPTNWHYCSMGPKGPELILPENVARFSSDAIYVFECKGKRLYGYTAQGELAKRLRSYFNGNSHPELLAEISQSPQNVRFALVESIGQNDPGERENAYITAYETYKPEKGYNRTKGSNGCRPFLSQLKLCKKPPTNNLIRIKLLASQ